MEPFPDTVIYHAEGDAAPEVMVEMPRPDRLRFVGVHELDRQDVVELIGILQHWLGAGRLYGSPVPDVRVQKV